LILVTLLVRAVNLPDARSLHESLERLALSLRDPNACISPRLGVTEATLPIEESGGPGEFLPVDVHRPIFNTGV